MGTGRRLALWAVLGLCPWLGAQAQQESGGASLASALSLGDGLEAALAGAAVAGHTGPATGYRSSSWLAALPSLGLSYLDSRESLGTDEAEISLDLPLKSPVRRRADEALRGLEPQLEQARGAARRLYYSGLLREAYWSHRIAAVQREGAREQVRLLERLAERQRALVGAASTPEYALLLVEREMLTARAREQGFRVELERWRLRYRELTGLSTLPATAPEPPRPVASGVDGSHPLLRLLELGWERQQALLDAGSTAAAPWTVSLFGRQLDSPAFTEDQIGLAVELPLSVFDVPTEAELSDRAEGARQYWQARDELLRELEGRRRALVAQRQMLEQQQALLVRAVELNQRIEAQLSALQAGNEIEVEVLLRRYLDIAATRMELAVVEARLGETGAMLRQAQGIPL